MAFGNTSATSQPMFNFIEAVILAEKHTLRTMRCIFYTRHTTSLSIYTLLNLSTSLPTTLALMKLPITFHAIFTFSFQSPTAIVLYR